MSKPSRIAVLRPVPPRGVTRCAASPMRKASPSRNRSASPIAEGDRHHTLDRDRQIGLAGRVADPGPDLFRGQRVSVFGCAVPAHREHPAVGHAGGHERSPVLRRGSRCRSDGRGRASRAGRGSRTARRSPRFSSSCGLRSRAPSERCCARRRRRSHIWRGFAAALSGPTSVRTWPPSSRARARRARSRARAGRRRGSGRAPRSAARARPGRGRGRVGLTRRACWRVGRPTSTAWPSSGRRRASGAPMPSTRRRWNAPTPSLEPPAAQQLHRAGARDRRARQLETEICALDDQRLDPV